MAVKLEFSFHDKERTLVGKRPKPTEQHRFNDETLYWIQFVGDFASGVWAKESELAYAD
jgi:hypothetical protein